MNKRHQNGGSNEHAHYLVWQHELPLYNQSICSHLKLRAKHFWCFRLGHRKSQIAITIELSCCHFFTFHWEITRFGKLIAITNERVGENERESRKERTESNKRQRTIKRTERLYDCYNSRVKRWKMSRALHRERVYIRASSTEHIYINR